MEYGTGVTATSTTESGSLVKARSRILSSLVGLSMTWDRLCLLTSFIRAEKARCGCELRSCLNTGMTVES